MSDNHTPQQRHNNMAAIHGKDTKPEMVVRRWLWGRGFRYRWWYVAGYGGVDSVIGLIIHDCRGSQIL